MLQDPLLQDRCLRHIESLIDLCGNGNSPHALGPTVSPRAGIDVISSGLIPCGTRILVDGRDHLVSAFRKLQERGRLEIITCAATHAVLPLLATHPPSVRAQVLIARDHYRSCFGCDPRGIWLPECAYAEGIEDVLREAGIRWFITDTHGILHARPKPRYGVFAPVFTPSGLAAFGRDLDSAQARSGAGTRVTRAMFITGISIAMSASTWILTMSNRICRTPASAVLLGSNITASPAVRAASSRTIVPPRCKLPPRTRAIFSMRASNNFSGFSK